MEGMCAIAVGTGAQSLIQRRTREEHRLRTGSGAVDVCRIRHGDRDVPVLLRHGSGAQLMPHDIIHAHSMVALRSLGVSHVIAVSAVGSLRPHIPVPSVIILDDIMGFISAESASPSPSPLGGSRHLALDIPYCPRLRHVLMLRLAGILPVIPHGTYAQVPGPRYETPFEVQLLRRWGCDVVGMTGVSELIAARQAGLCYASVACVTNSGTGLTEESPDHDAVQARMAFILKSIGDRLLDAALDASMLEPCPS